MLSFFLYFFFERPRNELLIYYIRSLLCSNLLTYRQWQWHYHLWWRYYCCYCYCYCYSRCWMTSCGLCWKKNAYPLWPWNAWNTMDYRRLSTMNCDTTHCDAMNYDIMDGISLSSFWNTKWVPTPPTVSNSLKVPLPWRLNSTVVSLSLSTLVQLEAHTLVRIRTSTHPHTHTPVDQDAALCINLFKISNRRPWFV